MADHESTARLSALDLPTPSLTAWTLGTVDASVFVLLGVLGVHASGALGDLLQGASTVAGTLVFLYLWVLFVVAVEWVLSGATLSASVRTLCLRGVAAGGVTGIVFLLGVLAAAALPTLASGSVEPLSILLITLFGVAVAGVVGAVVGFVAALVDLAVVRTADSFVPES